MCQSRGVDVELAREDLVDPQVDLEREPPAEKLDPARQRWLVKRRRAEHAHARGVDHVLAGDDPQQRGLARTVCADQQHATPGCDRQCHTRQHLARRAAIREVKVAHLDHRRSRHGAAC
jgi:hypothetical protein